MYNHTMQRRDAIAQRATGLRKAGGDSQQVIADLLGVSRQAYGKKESGEIGFSNEEIAAVADYYHVSTDYLLGRTDDPDGMPPALPACPGPGDAVAASKTLAAVVRRMFERQGLRGAAQAALFSGGALSVDEIKLLQDGMPPAAFDEERLIRFLRKMPMELIREWYRAARTPVPKEFEDLQEELGSIIDRISTSTDGSPEAMEYVIKFVKERFEGKK